VVLEKDGEDQLDQSCDKEGRVKEKRNILLHTTKTENANLIGHIFCETCLLKPIIHGKITGGIEVTGRCRQLLDDLKKRQNSGN
jgi:hypothetical protein